MSHFKLISSTKASDMIPVNKYVSQKTGITVIIANVEGPVVNGFFCLGTEAHDDDGLPHTLEHLIFLGSKRYPYKGILDLLANRCMAHGTNAWTDTDHTCYTIQTAGSDGMLTLLPIYLDHILRPTLTDQGFITEVHHIDGEGQDAGVVYCEIQGRENTADNLCERQLLLSMYPDSGYSAETGGALENLRTSTNNVKVRDFHKKFYRPENVTVILTGQIEAPAVFRAIEIIENDIVEKRLKETPEVWVKPWQNIPPAPKYGEYQVQWPADTEDCGQILLGWRGPTLTDDKALKEITSCAVLLRYLCETATSPLQRCLVEREDALAGDVSYNITENIASLVKIEVNNVPIKKLSASLEETKKCLAKVRSGDEDIDMDRMLRLVKKQLRESIATLESNPHHAIAFQSIGDALYSQNDNDFISRLNPQNILRELLEEPREYWIGILQKYFTDDMVVVIGSPSISLQTKMAEDEKKRIDSQREKLGEAGLAEKNKELKEAMDFNERPPPPGTLGSVPVPRCDNMKCHSISSWATDMETTCPYFDIPALPMYTRVHSLKTNFVYINLILDMSACDHKTRQWLPLLINSLGECPVRRGDVLVPHEQVISDTERLTVVFGTGIGLYHSGNFAIGPFGNFARLETRCEPCDYEEVVDHLYDILYSVEFTKERLLVFTQRLINDVAQVRRNGHKMVHDILRDSLYSQDSNVHWCTVLRQQKFLKQLFEQLNAGGDSAESVINEAKKAFNTITSTAWLHIATDFERYKLSTEPWKKFVVGNDITPQKPRMYMDADLMSGWGGGFIVGVGGVESNYLMQLSPGPRGYALDDVAPLLLSLNYFTQLEGPMWKLIRGCGLSYSYGIRMVQNEACLMFSLYKATNAVAAYSKAKTIIKEFLASGLFDKDLFASARSTAVFEAVEREKCPADVVNHSLLNYCKGVSDCYNRDLVCALAAVTEEQAKTAVSRWLTGLFDTTNSKIAVVCHPSKVSYTQSSFDKISVKLESFESMEASHFNK